MCRLVCFVGPCSQCTKVQDPWDELTQRLSCLQAKNAGQFGACERGVDVDEHSFQGVCEECDREDEAIGILEVDDQFVSTSPDIDFYLNRPSAAECAEKKESDKQGNKRAASPADDTTYDYHDNEGGSWETTQKKKQRT